MFMNFLIFTLAITSFSISAAAEDSMESLMAEESISLNIVPPLERNTGHRFSVGAGTGVAVPTGNLGKLYSTSSPLLDLRTEYRLDEHWGVRGSMQRGSFDFNAQPSGAVNVSLTSATVAGVVHPVGFKFKGFDPYLTVGLSQVFRSQSFLSLNDVQKDTALGAEVGLGSTYFIVPGKAALWAEAKGNQVFFRDRYEQTYAQSGIGNTTGLLFSTGAGVQYYF